MGGDITAVYAVMNFFVAPILGGLSYRYGRRPVLLISMGMLAIDFVIMGFAHAIWCRDPYKGYRAIAEKDAKGTLDVVDDLIGRGHDLRNFCRDLLGLCRDLLVFKVAGSETKLYESALLSPDQMRSASEPFTEADLLRFFNSLAETETKLKEASHSRHILEIGLIRHIEMRRVVAIEDILTRLSALETGEAARGKKNSNS